jgi:hypothetical protein
MTTPPEIARKVRQLDNDVQAIYEMLAGISATQQRQGNRLEEIAASQADLATAQAGLTAAQAEHGTKLDAILELLRGGPPAHGR